ncbi:hypothetical protein [Streptomyces nigra]|uniref:hypothetical protein n=1 Tax=Streptomyces nigra TaxID=1827580 RepID=UPI00341F10EA
MSAGGRPTLDDIEDRFVGLVAGRLARDEADRWAARWVTEDGIVWDDLSWWSQAPVRQDVSVAEWVQERRSFQVFHADPRVLGPPIEALGRRDSSPSPTPTTASTPPSQPVQAQ